MSELVRIILAQDAETRNRPLDRFCRTADTRSLLEEWLRRCMSTGDLDQMPVRALARLLIAMLTEASLALSRFYMNHHRMDDARDVLDEVLKVVSDDPGVHTAVGELENWRAHSVQAGMRCLFVAGLDPPLVADRSPAAELPGEQGALFGW